MATDLTVSRTILAQLGGNRFIGMTGAKSFVGNDDSLSFRLPSNITKARASGMRIVLEGDDTYTMETFKVVRFEARTLDTRRGVYADALRRTFTDMTGLDVSFSVAA